MECPVSQLRGITADLRWGWAARWRVWPGQSRPGFRRGDLVGTWWGRSRTTSPPLMSLVLCQLQTRWGRWEHWCQFHATYYYHFLSLPLYPLYRSEERRVGKECRS